MDFSAETKCLSTGTLASLQGGINLYKRQVTQLFSGKDHSLQGSPEFSTVADIWFLSPGSVGSGSICTQCLILSDPFETGSPP